MRQLTGPEIGAVQNIISKSYDFGEFSVFTKARLNKSFIGVVSAYLPYDVQVFHFIEAANRKYWHNLLLDALIAELPTQNYLKELSVDIGATEIYDGLNENVYLDRKGLESMVNGDPLIDIQKLIDNLEKSKRCVCRIEITSVAEKTSFGTGFLIAKDLLLTNYHVVQELIENPQNIKTVTCTFDYLITSGERSISGTTVKFAKEKPIEASSKFSPLDITGSADINKYQDETELDYAACRLERSVGDEPFGHNAENALNKDVKRGWIDMSKSNNMVFVNGHVIIIQHPNGSPLKIAFGFSKIKAIDNKRLRVRYEVNTAKGSSGSPCFDSDFNLIALHNMGDPNWAKEYNQGVYASRIYTDLKLKGVSL